MQKQDSVSYDGAGRRYYSHTMNTLDAVLTPGTPSNRLATVAVSLAAWHYRRRLMVLSLAYAILSRKRR
ncbi:hypothetical protein [Methanogenium cariaci]|uniref:hypothetical protein n=1 Tax=Methanogenium cariaci TaxID=2197 RepID=UPI0012F6DBEA|nr:hypothetical protein [Methanogenium cariaci]